MKVCVKVIEENSVSHLGHDAAFCEGLRGSWLHRWCADLTKEEFSEIKKSSNPFTCSRCQLKDHHSKIESLKS